MKNFKLLLVLLISILPSMSKGGVETIFTNYDTWKYLGDGTCLTGSSWRSKTYNDQLWSIGASPLGYIGSYPSTYEESDFYPFTPTTNLTPFGGIYYFRKNFTISDTSFYTSFTLKFKRNDAVIIYVNGTQIYKDLNLPDGDVTCNQLATSQIDNGTIEYSVTIPKSLIVKGSNTIAVEVHNIDKGVISNNSNILWMQN